MKDETYRTLMTVGLYLAVATLLLTLVVILKNIDEIKTDAILYGMEKNNFVGCSCYDTKGATYQYSPDGFVVEKELPWNVTLP